LYRDIASLRAEGAGIEGEPGVGYVLRPGYLLAPLSFRDEEIEAIALGLRWVAERGDARLASAAAAALGRIGVGLSAEGRAALSEPALLIGPRAAPSDGPAVPMLRDAIRQERKLKLSYRDGAGVLTERVVWPVAVGFMERVSALVAWCELRSGFRHFRTDRIERAVILDEPLPRRRRTLVREWREAESIPR
jgi:predicted DNA-binding transcriptional regulator YafY